MALLQCWGEDKEYVRYDRQKVKVGTGDLEFPESTQLFIQKSQLDVIVSPWIAAYSRPSPQ